MVRQAHHPELSRRANSNIKIQMIETESEIRGTIVKLFWSLEHSDLGFVSDFDIRYSNLNLAEAKYSCLSK